MLWLGKSQLVLAGRLPPALLDMSKADLISSRPEEKTSESQETTDQPLPLFPPHRPIQWQHRLRSPKCCQEVITAAASSLLKLYL